MPELILDNEGEPQSASDLLHAQHNEQLTLDTKLDNFWDRLRRGYAHDPAFKSPPTRYRFDEKLQVFFWENRLVIPDYDNLRKQVLMWHHVHPWHAHMGIHRTTSLITDTFHWPGIHADIKSFVSECHSCQTMKTSGSQLDMLSPLPIPTTCWRIVSLDMITQLPRTQSKMDCIVVFVDQFSKMVRLIAADSTLDGPGFAKIFFTQIYPHYGIPLGICSDRGVQWNNHFFKSLCEHLGIQLQLTYSYHPRANGQVERLNRVIEEALRHFVSPAHDDWDTFLPHIEFCINSAKNEATGCTPFQLNRITPPLSPTAVAFGLHTNQKPHPSLLHRMYYNLAKQSLSMAKQSMWSKPPEEGDLEPFQVGRPVLLSLAKVGLHHPSLRRKFTARWIGPCKILELVGSRAARIQLPTTLKQLRMHDVFHFSCLKPYINAHFHECTTTPQIRKDSDKEETYEVEAILDYRRTHRYQNAGKSQHKPGPKQGPHYKVRWKGYSEQHDLWLPVSELTNCLEKVADYLFQNASAAQRERMIEQFPKESRDRLTHMLQRAQQTRKKQHNPAQTTMSRPPREDTRPQRRSKRLRTGSEGDHPMEDPPQSAATSQTTQCSCCFCIMQT